MTQDKWSFGVEQERVAVVQVEGSTPLDTSVSKGHSRTPLVTPAADRTLTLSYERTAYLERHIPALLDKLTDEINEAVPVPAGSVVTRPPLSALEQSLHWKPKDDPLTRYTRWMTTLEYLLFPTDMLEKYEGYLLEGIEFVSPPLYASEAAFHHVREVSDYLDRRYWFLAAELTGLHIHVGRGGRWLSLHELRRVAGLCYAADELLAGLHPADRRENASCRSNRLYSYVSRGVRAEMIETVNRWHDDSQAVETPPRSTTGPSAPSPLFVRKIPRGELGGYARPPKFPMQIGGLVPDLIDAFPELSGQAQEPAQAIDIVEVPAAVRELLRCTDPRTVGELPPRVQLCPLPQRGVPGARQQAHDRIPAAGGHAGRQRRGHLGAGLGEDVRVGLRGKPGDVLARGHEVCSGRE
ncbi:hypothetical protein BKA67DRAFT_535424 [Truncatella angustata]|uniref:Uncharacterized protein n=1 Tax=Truncatella angustata TaxID=152316 RepID=A0A9P8UL33_9PEZI|nr:uncharacterized protein BKA67DRAFT_535424 [Truncatella angustata]KAH6654083.1 hypothetical protein BKA67DRAFT_535424 [Truncatella angustata]